MARKSITLFRDRHNFGAAFKDGNKITSWEELTRDEQIDLLCAMREMYGLFIDHIKDEEK